MKRPIHLKRVRAEVRLIPNQETTAQATTQNAQGAAVEARVLLNDLSPKGIGIYASTAMVAGQDITITIDEPKKIQLNGKVMWCQEQPTGGAILSAQPFNFRIGIQFVFAKPEDEEAHKNYCMELQQQHLYRPGP